MLALDVEGTIITSYGEVKLPNEDRYPAIIDKQLQFILAAFKKAGWFIVLATGTDCENLKYYQNEFIKAKIHQFIDGYSPNNHDKSDSKYQKLDKYKEQFQIGSKEQCYFYDDSAKNIGAAKENGYKNAFQVTDEHPLVNCLLKLAKEQNIKIDNISQGINHTLFAQSASSESTGLLQPTADQENTSCLFGNVK